MNSKVRFVQRVSLIAVLISFATLAYVTLPGPSPAAYVPPPTRPVSIYYNWEISGEAWLRAELPEEPINTRSAATWEAAYTAAAATWEVEQAIQEAVDATWEATNPEASIATRKAEQATREAEQATREAEQATWEAEQATRAVEQATWAVEYSTWQAGYGTWEAEQVIQGVVYSTQEAPAYTRMTFIEATQPPPIDWTLINVWLVTLISLAAFVTTTLYRTWDERRTRATHELSVVKTQLEIEKLRKEMEEALQKDKKRKP